MKRIFKIMLMVLFFVPFVVSAKEYTTGEIANFVRNDNENEKLTAGDLSVGQKVIYLKNTSDEKYVKALAILAGRQIVNNKVKSIIDEDDLTASSAYRYALSLLDPSIPDEVDKNFESPYIKFNGEDPVMTFITLDELKELFGADFTANAEVGTISVETWGEQFGAILTTILKNRTISDDEVIGFFTATVEDDKVWVVELGRDADNKLTKIEVKKVNRMNPENNYFVMPVLEFNKDFDCHETPTPPTYACYKCGDGKEAKDFIWKVKGTEPAGCKIVDPITDEKDCIPAPKTGVADYALEIIALVAVGTCLMVILKKKDFFIGA